MLAVGKRIATVSRNDILKTYCQNKNGKIVKNHGTTGLEYTIVLENSPMNILIPEEGIARYVIRVYNLSVSLIEELGDESLNKEILSQYGGNKPANVISAWKRLFKKYEGAVYCVKDMFDDKVIVSGVFDSNDIDVLKENLV